jgi:6-phosphofructokinase 1
MEIMGRNAGWLTASSVLGRVNGFAPDLVYLPEIQFDFERFLGDVVRVYKEKGTVLVAASEGLKFPDGSFVSEAKTSATDGFGHAQLGGLAAILSGLINTTLGTKVRGIELSLLQRCAAHCASGTDIEEAVRSGQRAVTAAVDGVTDKMVAIERTYTEDGQYVSGLKLLNLSEVANYEKKFPREWINEEGNNIRDEFIDYALPLIQGHVAIPREHELPRYARLKKIYAE